MSIIYGVYVTFTYIIAYIPTYNQGTAAWTQFPQPKILYIYLKLRLHAAPASNKTTPKR